MLYCMRHILVHSTVFGRMAYRVLHPLAGDAPLLPLWASKQKIYHREPALFVAVKWILCPPGACSTSLDATRRIF